MATSDRPDDEFFPYAFDNRWKPLFSLHRLDADDGVALTGDGMLLATFGRSKVETPITNIHHTLVTGDHRWYTAVGLRLSGKDSGITFGTNHKAGLCIEFIDRIPRVLGARKHAALWVSVADPQGLADAISRRT